MLSIALVVLAPVAAAHAFPFEITSNKPFVHVSVNDSAPQSFILDSGNSGNSMIARGTRQLEIRRGEQRMTVQLAIRRLV